MNRITLEDSKSPVAEYASGALMQENAGMTMSMAADAPESMYLVIERGFWWRWNGGETVRSCHFKLCYSHSVSSLDDEVCTYVVSLDFALFGTLTTIGQQKDSYTMSRGNIPVIFQCRSILTSPYSSLQSLSHYHHIDHPI